MTSRDFALLCKAEKESLVNTYFDATDTAAGTLIHDLELTPAQMTRMRQVVDAILSDAIYALLLGLDGAASIGGSQQPYELRDEQGNLLTGGQLESEAWQAFHSQA
jgi:hypothetical protein